MNVERDLETRTVKDMGYPELRISTDVLIDAMYKLEDDQYIKKKRKEKEKKLLSDDLQYVADYMRKLQDTVEAQKQEHTYYKDEFYRSCISLAREQQRASRLNEELIVCKEELEKSRKALKDLEKRIDINKRTAATREANRKKKMREEKMKERGVIK